MASTSDPRTTESNKHLARFRHQPVLSGQPSISGLSELGVKVRDFVYENILPPVPPVHLQPPQTQSSASGHVDGPNEIHNVLEAYLPESTRAIRRVPTEPILASGCVSPERHVLPKIKRTNALLDLSSQSDLQPPTGTIQSASQPIQLDTSILSSNGSARWSESPALTAISSTGPSIPSSQINYITAPSGRVFPNSQVPILSATVSPMSQLDDYSAVQRSLEKQISYDALTLPISLPPVLYPGPSARSTLQPSTSGSFSHLPPSTSALSNETMFPCYNLRRNKRRAEFPPFVPLGEYSPPRKRIRITPRGPGTAIEWTTPGVFISDATRRTWKRNGPVRRGKRR